MMFRSSKLKQCHLKYKWLMYKILYFFFKKPYSTFENRPIWLWQRWSERTLAKQCQYRTRRFGSDYEITFDRCSDRLLLRNRFNFFTLTKNLFPFIIIMFLSYKGTLLYTSINYSSVNTLVFSIWLFRLKNNNYFLCNL